MELSSYYAAWEALVTQHLHLTKFIRINTEELEDLLRNNQVYPAVICYALEGTLEDGRAGTGRDRMEGMIMVIDTITDGDYSGEATTMNNLKKWGAQLFARIRHLQAYPQCPPVFRGLDINNIRYEPTSGVYENCVGWLFSFSLTEPTNMLVFDQAQWAPDEE